jgi:hypothetical protein
MDITLKDKKMEPKKTEKLVSALYLLTGFFDDKEPMKWRLRELGGRLISQKESRNIVLEILGLLTVAKNAALISDTNYEIIHREFSSLVPQGLGIGEIFNRIEIQKEPEIKAEKRPQLYLSSSVPAQPVKDKAHRIPSKEPKEGVVAVKKNSRQTTILGLLKRKKEIMVKDVVPLIPGVSEKTIQRELLALVSSGILKKTGEKRWSKYSLADE